MQKITQEQLNQAARDHQEWIFSKEKGERKRAIFEGVDFRELCFNNLNFCGAAFGNCDMSNAVMENVNFSATILTDCNFDNSSLFSSSFVSSTINYCSFKSISGYLCNFDNAFIRKVAFDDADITSFSFHETYLQQVSFEKVKNLKLVAGDGIFIKTIQLPNYDVVFSTTHMQIGDEYHQIDQWFDFSDDDISKMSDGTLVWWKKWKPFIKLAVESFDVNKQ